MSEYLLDYRDAWNVACYQRQHSNLARCYIELVKRLELFDASGEYMMHPGDTDAVGCRNETIKLLDARIKRLTDQTDTKHEM